MMLLFGGDTEVVGSSLDLALSSSSRDQEREADAFGIQLVHDTYGDTEGCVEFFEAIQASGRPNAPGFLSSHPVTSERLETLRRLQAKLHQ